MSEWQSRAQLWRHFSQPVGGLPLTTPERIAEVFDSTGKQQLRLEISLAGSHIRSSAPIINQAAFQVFGGVALIACGSWLCEWLPGRSLAELGTQQPGDIATAAASALQLRAAERPAALLAEDAVFKLLAVG